MCPSVRVEVSRAEADNDIVHCCQSLPDTTVTRTPSTVSNLGGQVGFNSSVFLIIGRLILERKNRLSSSIQALGINYHKTIFTLNYANFKHVFYYIPFMEMWEWRTQKLLHKRIFSIQQDFNASFNSFADNFDLSVIRFFKNFQQTGKF